MTAATAHIARVIADSGEVYPQELVFKAAQQSRWISIEESLPALGQPVALLKDDRHACGHLAEFGGKYWSIRGERATSLDAFTHWLALPPAPEGEEA